ncbi:peptidoglycan bridge formation glycyltransferase FemA/FemB family protein, partial [Candidatus Peregrinibacteria bacterium]|nr:peptidoglycan bridge formation glycyltransferase FemA/FemB family protein [Candidatus Peregrinibacteria bacterium]
SIPYGPVVSFQVSGVRCQKILHLLMAELQRIGKDAGCAFIRMSPFFPKEGFRFQVSGFRFRQSPLHLLAEHLWYLPLVEPDPWEEPPPPTPPPCGGEGSSPSPGRRGRGLGGGGNTRTAEEIFKNMRATNRNLIRRAEKEGVAITTSDDPLRDLPLFLALHEETRKRHGFTPYTDAFFHAQVKHFSSPNTYNLTPKTSPRCTLYLANYKGEVIAASIHMHFAGETSYHHGASSQKYRNISASYLLQWHAIQDALQRGDHVYNFWGIAPLPCNRQGIFPQGDKGISRDPLGCFSCGKIPYPARHPFAGVTTFKTGFGGKPLSLVHCMDLPLSPMYYLTQAFEMLRKWRRGF